MGKLVLGLGGGLPLTFHRDIIHAIQRGAIRLLSRMGIRAKLRAFQGAWAQQLVTNSLTEDEKL